MCAQLLPNFAIDIRRTKRARCALSKRFGLTFNADNSLITNDNYRLYFGKTNPTRHNALNYKAKLKNDVMIFKLSAPFA